MKIKHLAFALITALIAGCNTYPQKNITTEAETYDDVKIVGAMKNVMWKGELGSSILLDTIANKKGLFGLGPVSYLRGELLINNGKSYVAKVLTDSTISIEKTFKTGAPFFVYANVHEWHEVDLPPDVKTIEDLEQFVDDKTKDFKRPFAFKLIGHVSSAVIHIQNLPEGTAVSSPKEAHQGQTDYELKNEDVEIVGFFSTEHQGVFTHHDSFLHMHLITKDARKMGHLDQLEIETMKLYLPKK